MEGLCSDFCGITTPSSVMVYQPTFSPTVEQRAFPFTVMPASIKLWFGDDSHFNWGERKFHCFCFSLKFHCFYFPFLMANVPKHFLWCLLAIFITFIGQYLFYVLCSFLQWIVCFVDIVSDNLIQIQLPAYSPESSRGLPTSLGSCTYVGDPEEALWLQISSILTIAAVWFFCPLVYSPICLSKSTFQTKHFVNLLQNWLELTWTVRIGLIMSVDYIRGCQSTVDFRAVRLKMVVLSPSHWVPTSSLKSSNVASKLSIAINAKYGFITALWKRNKIHLS